MEALVWCSDSTYKAVKDGVKALLKLRNFTTENFLSFVFLRPENKLSGYNDEMQHMLPTGNIKSSTCIN